MITKNAKTKIVLYVFLMMLVTWMLPFRSYAGTVSFEMDNQTEENSLQLEMLIDGYSYLINADTGYRYELKTDSKISKMAVRVMNDNDGIYSTVYPEEVDFSQEQTITISVIYSSDYIEEGDHFINGETAVAFSAEDYVFVDNTQSSTKEKIDLSNGTNETATLIVSCKPVYAVNEVVLTLFDNNYNEYKIPLHLDPYLFTAEVTLPAGLYRESGTPALTFNEAVSEDEKITYHWAHSNGSSYGGFIELKVNETVEMDELTLMMTVNGNTQEMNSRYFLNKKQYEEESKAAEQKEQAFRESAYQNLVIDNAVNETTEAFVETTEDQGLSAKEILAIVLKTFGLLTLAFIAAGGIWLYRMYKENNRLH